MESPPTHDENRLQRATSMPSRLTHRTATRLGGFDRRTGPSAAYERGRWPRVEAALLASLKLAIRDPSTFGGAREVAAVFADSVRQLESRRLEAEAFLRLACQLSAEVRATDIEPGSSPAAAFSEHVRELCRRIEVPPSRRESEVTGTVLRLDPAAAYERLLDALKHRVAEFVGRLRGCLERFAQAGVFGVAEWSEGDACSLTFFRTVLVDEDESGSPGRHTLRRSRHEHRLVDASWSPLGRQASVVPSRYSSLVRSVPEWLRPAVGVIEGEQVGERRVEKDLESWSPDIARVSDGELSVGEGVGASLFSAAAAMAPMLLCFLPDPAIVVDEYVLVGWSEQTEASRDARPSARELAAPSRPLERMPLAGLGAMVLVATSVACFLYGDLSGVWQARVAAFGVLAVATLPASETLRCYASLLGVTIKPVGWAWGAAALGVTWLGVLLAAAFAIVPSWNGAWAAFFGLYATAGVWNAVHKSLKGEPVLGFDT